MTFVTLGNFLAALFNLIIWAHTGNDLNLFCFGVSLGVTIMLTVNLYTGGWGG